MNALRFIRSYIERPLPADGDVLIWDIDKTYLDTRFSSMRGLLAIPFELAVDKRAIHGTVPLLRALRLGPVVSEPRFTPLYFISGSPPSLKKVIEQKMLLDGVQPDGLIFKDQFGLVRAGRPRTIKEQVGYKLNALLGLYAQLPRPESGTVEATSASPLRFTLFGDDVEMDMISFLLFGAVCAGLRGADLRRELQQLKVGAPEIEAALQQSDPLPVRPDPVGRVCISNVRGKLIERRDLDPRVRVTRASLQTALVLRQDGLVPANTPAAVAEELRRRNIDEDQLRAWADDAAARLGVDDIRFDQT